MRYIKNLAILIFTLLDKYIHQKRIISFIKKNIKKVDSFIDVGAHRGIYSDLILKNFKKCKIHMFEPQKKIFAFLKTKYKKQKNIKIYNCALSDSNSTKILNINNHDLTSSLLKLNQKNKYLRIKARLFGTNLNGMILRGEKIKTLKLEKFLNKKLFNKRVDLIKIDTEGHELNVLKGIKANIKKINYIMIEFHLGKTFKNYDSKKIHTYLIQNKFILKKICRFPFSSWEDRFYKNSR